MNGEIIDLLKLTTITLQTIKKGGREEGGGGGGKTIIFFPFHNWTKWCPFHNENKWVLFAIEI